MIALLGLVAVMAAGGVAALLVRTQTGALAQNRAVRIAQYAAETGAAVAADYLARSCQQTDMYTQVLARRELPAEWGNGAGCADGNGEPWFSEDMNRGIEPDGTDGREVDNKACYKVTFENNEDDPSGGRLNDNDATVLVRATGFGPRGAQAMVISMHRNDACLGALTGKPYAMDGFDLDRLDFPVETSIVETTNLPPP